MMMHGDVNQRNKKGEICSLILQTVEMYMSSFWSQNDPKSVPRMT